jgi:hypothetical protein
MTREDHVLALMADANPVSDPSTFVIDPETRARLETIEHWSETMEEGKIRSIEPAPKKSRRNWLVGAGAAAVLVLIVGLGSWAVISGDSGADVAGSGEPTVTFDGATCTYAGPTEFVVGIPQTMLFVNTSDAESDINVWRVADGTTIDDVDPSDVRGTADYLNLSTTWFFAALPGNEKVVNGEFYRAGDWLISCQVGFPFATDSTPEGDYPGAIIQVVEG